MTDNKGEQPLKDVNGKIKLVCYGVPGGNKPATIDITDLLNWDDCSVGQYFGGVIGFVHEYNDCSNHKIYFSSRELDKICEEIYTILDGAIVNANQLKALKSLVYNSFHSKIESKQLEFYQTRDKTN